MFVTRTLRHCLPLQGKTAIVTASTDGIGLAVARRLGQDRVLQSFTFYFTTVLKAKIVYRNCVFLVTLSQDGAKVWISSRKEENVERALDELRSEELDVDGEFSKLLARSCYKLQRFFGIAHTTCDHHSASVETNLRLAKNS